MTRTKAKPVPAPSGTTPRAPRGSALARVLEDLREAGGLGGTTTPRPAAPHPLARVALGTGRGLAPLLSDRAAVDQGSGGDPVEDPESTSGAASPVQAAADPAGIAQPVSDPVEELEPPRPGPEAPAEEPAAEEPAAEEPAAEEPAAVEAAAVEAAAVEAAAVQAAPAEPTRDLRREGLDSTLTATIRRWAKPTTPKELEARGVKRVRSVSMSRIASLIEKAINRELIARTLEGDTDDALSLSANARAGFLELARQEMSGRVDAEAESSAFADLDRLRAELEARRAELEEKERRLDGRDPGVEDDSFERRLRAVFASRAVNRDPELEREVVRVALEELGEMRSRARDERRAESRRETNQLERRIAKLAGLLEQTEGELRRTRARKEVDPGLASVFTEVQGLDLGDERFAQKQDLMKCIFEANLALQN
ncbi:MAG: hypothetical protein ISQ11_12055 [Planctomycetes bacterium]|nr:hypothetical protein [Planctomycetota bacterium]